MLEIGVIGVGYLGSLHARVLSELDDVALVGVADIRSERAEEVAFKYGCRWFRDYRDLLPLAEAMVIATPTITHYEIALECLNNNKDLFIEKPITDSLCRADHLIEEAHRRGRIIQVGHLERFNSALLLAERYLRRPLFFESLRLSPYLKRGTDVDITLDLMIHDIDIILSLTRSTVEEIHATGASVLSGTIDVAKAWLVMKDGTQALVTASRLSAEKKRQLRAYQADGMVYVDYLNQEVTVFRKTLDGQIQKQTLKPEEKEPLKEELMEFVNAVSQRRQPKVNGIHGREALKVAIDVSRRIKGEGT